MSKIAIIGAGISGLTLAYYLNKYHPKCSISVYEKEKNIGGKIQTIEDDYGQKNIFGPKTVVMKDGSKLKELVVDLNLIDSVIYPRKESKKRLISYKGKLIPLPNSILDFFKKPYRFMLLPVICELLVPKKIEDESVKDFFQRRFGDQITNYLVDPLIKGIYGGGIEKLSIQETFPNLKNIENKHGSVLKGFFKEKKSKKDFFSFKDGLFDLISALKKNTPLDAYLNTEVLKIEKLEQGVNLYTNGNTEFFDHVFIATDLIGLQKLIPSFSLYFSENQASDVTQVIVNFEKNYKLDAFGCLFPTVEKEKALGVLFDSSIFESDKKGTTVTVMIEKTDEKDTHYKSVAIDICKNMLLINEEPKSILVKKYPKGIFLPKIKHQQKLKEFLLFLKLQNPFVSILGSGLKGVSVADQIQNAYNTAKEFSEKINDCSFI